MKLSKINTIGILPNQLRIIFNGQSQLAESVIQRSKNQNFLPLSYLFIESVIATKVLSEAELGRLGSLVQAGMAKLNAAMMPGSGKDLDLLLQFTAPSGGGSEAVMNMIRVAGQKQGDINSDEQWWSELFKAFGVADDPTIQNNVRSQVQQKMSSPEAASDTAAPETPESPKTPEDAALGIDPEAASAEPVPIGSQPGSPGSPGSPAPAGSRGELLDTLRQERSSEQSYQADIARQLDAVRKQRGDTQAAIGHLQNRLEKALQRQGSEEQAAVESISADVALILMNEEAVIQNIGTIGNYMIRQIGIKCRCSTPVLSEAGLLDKLGGAVKSGRNLLANPQVKQRLGATTSSANNTKAAKFAVQLLADQVRSTFKLELAGQGLTPEAITNKLEVWSNLKELEKQSGGNPSPKLVSAMLKASQELKDVFKLFKQGRSFKSSEFAYDAPEATEVTDFSPSLSKRDKVILQSARMATGQKFSAAKYDPANEQKYINSMAGDDAWARLMNGRIMRSAAEKELSHYAVWKQNPDATIETLPQKARVVVLKRIFDKI